MKTIALACLLSSFCALGVRADLTVVQKVQGQGQDMENTWWFKGAKTRVDTSPATSIIMNTQSGETIDLMHAPKTYVKVSSTTVKPAIEGANQGRSGLVDPKSDLVATGKSDTISGFTAEEYTCTMAGVRTTLWLTKALPDYKTALKEISGSLTQGPMGPIMQSYGADVAKLPGFPIRTVLEFSSGAAITRTVISVSTMPVPDSEFEIPAGYQEITVPVLTPPAAAKPTSTPS